MRKELTENPEFFKAFPHMQVVFNVKEDEDKVVENPKYYHDKQIGFKDKVSEEPYFDSLLYASFINEFVIIDTTTTSICLQERKKKQSERTKETSWRGMGHPRVH